MPRRDELAFGLFFDFMDHAWIERFFKPAQRVFPRLSMEIRVDGDAIMDGSGELAYYHRHHSAWDLPGAEWTTVYWSPAMEGVNQGETLSPQIAAQRLADQLSKISDLTNDRPIFIDQFLVQDFTPGFEQQGRLKPERVTDFLQRTAPVLRRHAHGYALWAWRDYRHNAVPSPDFLEAENGWQLAPDAAAVADLLPFHFEPGQVLTRSFNAYEFHAGGNPRLAQLCVHAEADGDEAVDLRVILEENALSVDVSGQGTACVDLPMADPMALTIEALSPLRLLQLELFAFTHTIGIRDLGGAPKPGMSDWRQLNARLVDAIP